MWTNDRPYTVNPSPNISYKLKYIYIISVCIINTVHSVRNTHFESDNEKRKKNFSNKIQLLFSIYSTVPKLFI